MNLYILRHGIAVDHGTPGYPKDSDRPLTPKGERKLWQVTEAMKALELSFDLILTSPLVRARQTADIVAEAFGARRLLEETEHLIPSGSTNKLVAYLNSHKPPLAEALLVGHEPYLSELISLLICGEAGASVLMKKGGLCKLSASQLRDGRCATLEWLLTPKQMGLMA